MLVLFLVNISAYQFYLILSGPKKHSYLGLHKARSGPGNHSYVEGCAESWMLDSIPFQYETNR